MGIISDQMAVLNDEVNERNEVQQFRSIAMEITDLMVSGLKKMDDIKTGGNDFNTIPNETKQVLLRWETAFKTVKQSLLSDAEIIECYTWRP